MYTKYKFKFWLIFIFIAMLSTAEIPFRTSSWTRATQISLEKSHGKVDHLQQLLSLMTDAETGQRGFIITGSDEFLDPYYLALAQIKISRVIFNTEALMDGDQNAAHQLFDIVDLKLAELERTIALRRSGGFDAVAPIISAAKGKHYMDQIREMAGQQIANEERRYTGLRAELEQKTQIAAYLNLAAVLLNLILLAFTLRFLFHSLSEKNKISEALRKSSDELNVGFAKLEQRNAEIALMAQMTQALESVTSIKETCGIIGVYCAKLLPFGHGALYLFRNSRDILEKEAEWGASDTMPMSMEPRDCWALRQGYTHVAASLNDLCCGHYHLEQGDAKRYVCVPLMAQSEVLGLICLEILNEGSEIAPLESQRKDNLARAVSEQIALGLSNAKLREVLQQQSIIDPLTGLFNRRYMDETLKRELARANRNSASLSLILLDIDHFKKVNDTYGHEAGDAVLSAISNRLKNGIRECDMACRFGGEELVLILPDCSGSDAVQRAEKLRESIQSLNVQHGTQHIGQVSASFGVAAFPLDGTNAESLFQAADRAMYAAKHNGRNRVVMAS